MPLTDDEIRMRVVETVFSRHDILDEIQGATEGMKRVLRFCEVLGEYVKNGYTPSKNG